MPAVIEKGKYKRERVATMDWLKMKFTICPLKRALSSIHPRPLGPVV
jgi:hypothetical protein